MNRRCAWQVLLATAFAAFAVTAQAADRYWVASAAANWNDTANWSATSGGDGGQTVPGGSDIAIFDGNGTGNCTINVNANVSGISITAGYSGTISQGAQEVVVGTSHFTQAGGTYTCAAGDLKVYSFRLDGGTFTAPSSLMEIGVGLDGSLTDCVRVDSVAATFNHNNGRIRFVSYADANATRTVGININSGTWTVHDLDYRGGHRQVNTYSYSYSLGASDTIVVEGDLLLSPSTEIGDNSRYTLDNGTHQLYGNLTLGNALTPNTNSVVYGLQGGSTVVEFVGAAEQTYAHYTEHRRGPKVTINKTGGKVSAADGFDDLTIHALILQQGTFEMPDGATLTLDSSFNASITQFSLAAGATFDAGNIDLVINAEYSNSSSESKIYEIELNGTLAVSNLTFSGGNAHERTNHKLYLLEDDKFEVGGDLLIQNGLDGRPSMKLELLRGAIDVHGNVVFGNPLAPSTGGYGTRGLKGSTTDISLVGSEDQTILHYWPGTNTIPSTAFTLNKTGGTAMFLSNVRLARADQDLIWTAGALDLGTNTLTVNRNVTIGTGATTLGVTVADATTAGNIAAGGDASALDNVGLVVTVTGERQQIDGQTYTILSNSATVQEFADVTWAPSLWSATVVYDDTAVVLSDVAYSPPGTVILFR